MQIHTTYSLRFCAALLKFSKMVRPIQQLFEATDMMTDSLVIVLETKHIKIVVHL